MIHLSRSQVESSKSEMIPLGSSSIPSRSTVIGWSQMVNFKMRRPVRGVESDADEVTREEPESVMEIGESSNDLGRVSESIETRGLPRPGDLLLTPGARREKPGSPKAGQKGTDVSGGATLDNGVRHV